LASASLEDKIIPELAKNKIFNKNTYKGITYCNQNGQWKVYNTISLVINDRDTNIPE
jgi:hypothetical protein